MGTWHKNGPQFSYTHGTIFETFPFPTVTSDDTNSKLNRLGKQLLEERADYMVSHDKGMTDFYNDLHDRNKNDDDIQAMRALQVEINEAVLSEYAFEGIKPDYGFHEVAYLPDGQNLRYGFSEEARVEILTH